MEKVFELVFSSLPNTLVVQTQEGIHPYIFALNHEDLELDDRFVEELESEEYELCFRVNQKYIVIMYASIIDYDMVEFLVLSKNKKKYMINYDFKDEQAELTSENLKLAFETEFGLKID